jgi:hypothetical protein
MLGVSGDRLVTCSSCKPLNQLQKRRDVVVCNCTICTRVLLIRAECAFRHHHRGANFLIAVKEPKLRKIAGAPAAQLLETLELPTVLLAPAGRIGRLRWGLELDEGARGTALSHESDIRPPDTRVSVFRNNDQPRRDGEQGNQSLEQPLKSGGKRRLRNGRIGSAEFPDAVRVSLKDASRAHHTLVTCAPFRVICRASSGGRALLKRSQATVSEIGAAGPCARFAPANPTGQVSHVHQTESAGPGTYSYLLASRRGGEALIIEPDSQVSARQRAPSPTTMNGAQCAGWE